MESPTKNDLLFDLDLFVVKGKSFNILEMSEKIRIQDLIALSEEPPYKSGSPTSLKWDNTASSLSTRRQNNTSEIVEEESEILPYPLMVIEND